MADVKTPTGPMKEVNQQAGIKNQSGQESIARGQTSASAAMTIPAANAVEVVAVQAGAELPIAFSLDDVEMTVVGGDLQLGFENGSTLVLRGFATQAATDNPPTLMMADGTILPGDAVIFSYADTELVPAAGPALGSGGVGTYRSDMGQVIAGVGRLGTQDPGTLAASEGTILDDQSLPLDENAPPDAIDDVIITPEDTAVIIPVLENDTDLEGDTLVVDSVTQGENGTVAINADGTVTYTPGDNFNGSDSFTYTISDGQGGTDTATVNVDVAPVNDVPVAADDTYVTTEDVALVVDGSIDPTVLANDNDLDLDSLTVNTTPISDVSNGTLVLNADGTFTYTPDPNYNGSDSFVYEISDGAGGTAQATANITVDPVNDPPVAVDDTATTNEDSTVNITVLDDDSDPDGDPLDIISFTDPQIGAVTENVDGTFTYDPEGQFGGLDDGETATESFTYTISDSQGGTDTATVDVTIEGANDPPVAVDDGQSVNTAVLIGSTNTMPTGFYLVSLSTPDDPNAYTPLFDVNVKMDELSYDASGTLWAAENSNRVFYTVNILDGTLTEQFQLPAEVGNDIDGFVFGSIGGEEKLYVLGGSTLFVVDPGTVEIMASYDLSGSSNDLADLVLLNGNLYTISSNGAFFEINLDASGNIDLDINNAPIVDTLTGSESFNSVYGLVAGSDGLLYVVTSTGNSGEASALIIDSDADTYTVDNSWDLDAQGIGGNFIGLAGQVNPATEVFGNVLVNDYDLDNLDGAISDTLTVMSVDGNPLDDPADPNDPVDEIVINGEFGILTMNSDGGYSYDLTDELTPGIDAFTYTVTDGSAQDSAELTFSVNNYAASTLTTQLEGLQALMDVDGPMIYTFSANGGDGDLIIEGFNIDTDIIRLTDVLDLDVDGALDPGDVAVSVAAQGSDLVLTISGQDGIDTNITLADVGYYQGIDSLDSLSQAGFQVEYTG